MADSNWVKVDAARAAAAAAALEELRNALAEQVPAIMAALADLRSAGAAMTPPGSLTDMAAHAGTDAAQMRAAADLAARMERLTPGAAAPVTGMVRLTEGWDDQALTRAAARADAAMLTAALAEPAGPSQAAAIAAVARDVADHQGDTGYLTAFWSAPGVAVTVAGLAGALNRANGHDLTALTKPDQAILATYGASLAAATRSGQLSDPASHALDTAFSRPATLWSAAMLLKYGPAGSAYATTTGAGLLAAMSRAALNNPAVIVPVSMPQAGGMAPGVTAIEQQQGALAEYDPLTAILSAAAQNGAAAAEVLGGPAGENYAHVLLATQWNTGGGTVYPPMDMHVGVPRMVPGIDTSAAPAAFLYAATADRASAASARSVLSILGANAQIPAGTTFAPDITGVLISIAESRAPDLALTAGQGDASASPGVSTSHGVPLAIASQSELDAFLRRIVATPVNAGRYLGSLQAKLSLAVRMEVAAKGYWVRDVGALIGFTQRAIGERNFQGAEQVAAAKARDQEIATLLLAPVMSIPTPSPAKLLDLFRVGALRFWRPRLIRLAGLEGSEVLADNVVSSGDPARVLFASDQAFVSAKTAAHLAVVQGLVQAGVLKPNPSFYRDGHIVNGPGLALMLNQPTKTATGATVQWWVQQAIDGIELQQ